MKEQDIMQEIEQLKQQLEALTAGEGRTNAGPGAPEGGAQIPDAAGEQGTGSWIRDIVKQAEELLGGLDLQLKDVPARTALVIFALGVLTGRLLSRKG